MWNLLVHVLCVEFVDLHILRGICWSVSCVWSVLFRVSCAEFVGHVSKLTKYVFINMLSFR